MGKIIDMEINDDGARARFYVRGVYDALWTDDLEAALAFLRDAALELTQGDDSRT